MYKHLIRGCGKRKAGATYATTRAPTERGISPLDLDFTLICPVWVPWQESPAEIGLAAQGILILERRDSDGTGMGIWDIWDWISEADYPYFPDFFVEAQYYGTSRLVPVTAPFRLLSKDSRHFFVHAKAIIEDPKPVLEEWEHLKDCPKDVELHLNPVLDKGLYESCLGYLWEAIGPYNKDSRSRHVQVELPHNRSQHVTPSCVYEARSLPKGVDVTWKAGVPMWDAIEVFEIVEDQIDKKHERAIKLIEESGTNIPYMICEE